METDWISINGSKLIWENNYGFWVYIKPDFWWSGEQKWSGIDFIFIVYNKSITVNQKFKASVGISRIFTNFKACPGSSNFFSQNLRLVPVKIDIFPEFTIIKGFLLWQKPLLVSEPPLKANRVLLCYCRNSTKRPLRGYADKIDGQKYLNGWFVLNLGSCMVKTEP